MSRVWIFQANPTAYDLSTAIRELPVQTWSVRQHRHDIRAGDRAYLWLAGKQGGLAGSASVLTDPATMEMDPEELPYAAQDSGLGEAELRVRIHIDRIFDPPIPRAEIAARPALRSLKILAQPQGTNFPVSADEAIALEEVARDKRSTAVQAESGARNVPWDPRMLLVGYFLSRCGTEVPGEPAAPPHQLQVESWNQAFGLFYGTLGGGRTPTVFMHSLKGIRDRYDPHVPESGRVGWLVTEESGERAPSPLTGAALHVFEANEGRSCEELWADIEPLISRPQPISFDESWDNLTRWLEANRRWSSLVHERGYELESVEGDRVLYRRMDTGRGDEMTRSELEGLWERIRESPVGYHPTTSSRSATLALLPNIEYATGPLTLFWVDPPSHAIGVPTRRPSGAPGSPPLTLAAFADRLYLDAGYVEEVRWLLEDRRQLVFYGPPGTGKTWVAERLAEWYAGDAGRVQTIQFHPSYAYEDFVEGIRPILGADELRYALVPGLLKQLAHAAAEDPEHEYVLVIDEINRANLSRVFGELLYLLEYRERSLRLPYSEERFALPRNLSFIGTMNTADRSIALVDFALRRRFHFVEFSAEPKVLRRWLATNAPTMAYLADMLDWVNAKVADPNFAIGFSYFMRQPLDEPIARRVWDASILPALREYYFDDADGWQQFGFDRVRAATMAPSARPDEPAEGADRGDSEEQSVSDAGVEGVG